MMQPDGAMEETNKRSCGVVVTELVVCWVDGKGRWRMEERRGGFID